FAQPAVVGKMAYLGIGKPWRHLLADNGGLDGLGPRAGLCVGQERHRGNLAGPMALLTIVLENGKNVFVERHGVTGSHSCGAHETTRQCNTKHTHKTPPQLTQKSGLIPQRNCIEPKYRKQPSAASVRLLQTWAAGRSAASIFAARTS